MKLYATAKSERASKGQGGNKFIDIAIQAGPEREVIAFIKVTMPDDQAVIEFNPLGCYNSKGKTETLRFITKGK